MGSSATKREARAYLQRFTPIKNTPSAKKDVLQPAGTISYPLQHPGVNLGSFYGTRAVHESPRFIQEHEILIDAQTRSSPLHIALVKIRASQNLNDDILSGVCRTLSQLGKLGLTSTVVVDVDNPPNHTTQPDLRAMATQQADRIVAAIDAFGAPGARNLDNIIGIFENETDLIKSAAYVRRGTHVMYRKLLLTPLRRGVIPVVPSLGFDYDTHRILPVEADDVVLALTREFAGLRSGPLPDEDPVALVEKLKELREEVSLDRLILLDPLGGVPTPERSNGCHVFLNLEQEFGFVKEYLLTTPVEPVVSGNTPVSTSLSTVSDLAPGYPFPHPNVPGKPAKSLQSFEPSEKPSSENMRHISNIELVRSVLSLLPPTSSALLTTPLEAANSEKQDDPSLAIGVGTRRQQNPLIHNLLTDKPVYSSSLPAGRLGQVATPGNDIDVGPLAYIPPTTFVKRGMSVTIFPDYRVQPWEACVPGQTRLTLTDPRIDLARLVHLIDDSFNRKLDVQDYLKRINGRIAGVIIAGEYEGCALFTWETPPGVLDDGSEENRARMVPYLDKFAVLKRSQGAGGVADILFNAMVKDCFPSGVCWRSRRDNPVNKWYFERSRGTWQLPNTNWTMFWTTPDLELDPQKFSDYEGVCKSIAPSWADQKTVVD